MTRAEFLRASVVASAGCFVPAALPRMLAAAQADDDRRGRISRVIEAYDRQGVHRTATAVDNASAAWLLDSARQAGGDAALESFAIERVDPGACFITAGDTRIDGVPLFDGTFTDQRGVTGRLGDPGSAVEIVLTSVDQAGISSEGRSLAELRRGPHRAVVVITRGAHAGLSPMNAAAFHEPFGVPALQVSSEHSDWLAARAAAGTNVHVVVHATRARSTAQNVVVTVKGSDATLAPVVVITPRSGWWHCASERGGGLACWLESIRFMAAARPARSTMFVASSGHELGHLGLESFIDRRRTLVKGAAAWVHLGANIGAAGGRARLQASDSAIESVALAALARAGTGVQQRVAIGTVPAGEARNIHLGGGRYVSLLGSNPFFHSPADRWPSAVDLPAVSAFAKATADLVATLASRVTEQGDRA